MDEETEQKEGSSTMRSGKAEEVVVRGCVIAGLLVAAWAQQCYSAVEALLPVAISPAALDNAIPAVVQAFQNHRRNRSTKSNSDEDDDRIGESDALQKMYEADGLRVDSAAETFLCAFVWLAIVNVFRRGLHDAFRVFHSSERQAEVALLANRLSEALIGWEVHLQHRLRLGTSGPTLGLLLTAAKLQPERKMGSSGPSFTTSFPLVGGVSLLIKASHLHRTRPEVPALWTSILQQKGCVVHLESELSFFKDVRSCFLSCSSLRIMIVLTDRCPGLCPPSQIKWERNSATTKELRFSEPVALYRDKDRDLLISFALSTVLHAPFFLPLSSLLCSRKQRRHLSHKRTETMSAWPPPPVCVSSLSPMCAPTLRCSSYGLDPPHPSQYLALVICLTCHCAVLSGMRTERSGSLWPRGSRIVL